MRKILLLLSCAAALALSSTAAAAPFFGVAEDEGKSPADAGLAFFSTLKDIGLSANRITILWDPAAPNQILNKASLDVWMPQATISGVRVMFAVYPAHARDITSSPDANAQFASFLQQLAQAYPQVQDFIVGNEPNLSRFWQPQFNADGSGASGAAYEAFLAQSYDALKAVDPSIRVIGLGLSPRGNDDANASSNISTSPVRFLHDVAAAYKASGRTKPLMDELAFHPYPNQNTDPLSRGYLWPNAGLVNLDRIKQAVWDGFNGSGQPVFAQAGRAESAAGETLKLDLDETGWQVGVLGNLVGLYFGKESVPTIDEATQASIYADVVKLVSCDSSIRSLNFFHLIDEKNLDRWQSGFLRADGTRRPAYDAVKNAIAQSANGCTAKPASFTPETDVQGPKVGFGNLSKPKWWKETYWSFVAGAKEQATFRAGIFRVKAGKAAIRRALAVSGAAKPVLTAKGNIKANSTRLVRFPARRLQPGSYVYGIKISAAMNAQRSNVFVSKPFKVGKPAKKRR